MVKNSLPKQIEEFVRSLEKEGVQVTGWDDEAAYFNHRDFQVRVRFPYPERTHVIETTFTHHTKGR